MSITNAVIRKYRSVADAFVETGTYLGDTVEMARVAGFSPILSIEVSKRLATAAAERFSEYPHIKCFYGDSAKHMPLLLRELTVPALFWLDGHWSQGITEKGEVEVPLMQELEAIKYHNIKTHTIMIDDIRLLGDREEVVKWGELTLDRVQDALLEINSRYQFAFEDGVQPNDILVAYL